MMTSQTKQKPEKSGTMQAEARVSGVLRGGVYDSNKKTFVFHGPHRTEVSIDIVSEFKIFEPRQK